MKRIINWIFSFESITGGGVCPPYLFRWTLLNVKLFRIYLHQFVGDDWALDPHDHPKRFVSIGIKGWYYEDVCNADGMILYTRKHQAPWIRSFPPYHIHRIRAKECGNCWTVVIVFRNVRQWGFIQNGKWIRWDNYVWGGNARKNC